MTALNTATRQSIAELADVLRQTKLARQQALARRTVATQEVAGHTLAEVIEHAQRQGITQWPLRSGREQGLWVNTYAVQGAA